MKKYLPFILIFIIIIGISVAVQQCSPKQLDWRETLDKKDKIPYGTYILHDQLPKVFKGANVEDIDQQMYILTEDNWYTNTNFLFLNQNFGTDMYDGEKILQLADSGNQVFIIANTITGDLADTLKLSFNSIYQYNENVVSEKLHFVSPSLEKDKKYEYKNGTVSSFISNFDTAKTTVLAVDDSDRAVFIKVKWGMGNVFINTAPIAFTNYYILKDNNNEFAFKALSYMPVQDVIWNDYYQTEHEKEQKGDLSFILSREPLRWAFYLMLASLLLYILFEGKRTQRILPIMVPFRNTTLEFAETIGKLYFERKDHRNLADKKITYFFEYLRLKLHLRPKELDEAFYQQFSVKTGMSQEDTQNIFSFIKWVLSQTIISEEELYKLNGLIDDFYNRMNIK